MEQAINSIDSRAGYARRSREWLWLILFMLACAIFLFADGQKIAPIALKDEARNANNALEMYLNGFSLVTTYDFRPDLWNTKPPLAIWLMSGSIAAFGPTEWAIRLPSALAALGTLLCTVLFVRRVTASLATAILAATLLLLSPGFFGEHGARTGDYDAPLLFFVTAGLQLLFFAVNRARPQPRLMIALGTMIALGAMTKSIAAFIPFAGALVYAVAVGRFLRLLRQWQRYLLAGAVAVGPLLLFYALREAALPGYVAQVLHNDILGRFTEPLTADTTSPTYYFGELFMGWFFAGPTLVAVPLALYHLRGRTRTLGLYAICIVVVSLGIYSAAATRAMQYALPIFPWLSVAAAITLRFIVETYILRPWHAGSRPFPALVAAALLLLGAQLGFRAAYWRYEGFPARQFYPQATYGDLFAELVDRNVRAVRVVEPGISLLKKPGYAPLLHWHRLVWRDRGLATTQLLPDRAFRWRAAILE